MAFELKMPKLGESVTEGTIGKWLKQPGEQVKKYDLLVEVQTDKVNTEIPSEVDGTLSEIKVQEGQTVSVGTVLAVLETGAAPAAAAKGAAAQPAEAKGAAAQPAQAQGGAPQPAEAKTAAEPAKGTAAATQPAEAKAGAKPAQDESKVAAPAGAAAGGEGRATASPGAAEAPAAPPAQQTPQRAAPVQGGATDASSGNGKAAPPRPEVRATPAVRKLAAEHGIDIAQIEGSGLGGRVSRQDIEQFVASRETAAPEGRAQAPAQPTQGQARAAAPQQAAPRPAALAGDTPVPLTQMRRAIATNMVQAWSAPHAHAVMEVDMTNLMRFRETVKGDFQKREGFDLSPAAFIVKAAVEALSQMQAVNSSWTDQGVVLRKSINIGYAVALGEDGLVVPVIKNADEKSITGLMRAIRDVVDRAKAKKLTLDDFQGGTFTVNNTGPLGTFVSSPIVPPGQAAIISSESIRKRVVVMDDDSIAIRQMMNLVIGFDHRAIDGSTAARFLATIRDWLQGINEAVPIS